jgi:hypothetical protein
LGHLLPNGGIKTIGGLRKLSLVGIAAERGWVT